MTNNYIKFHCFENNIISLVKNEFLFWHKVHEDNSSAYEFK